MANITDNEKLQTLLKLADAAWADFDKRRAFEWKVNFALWAGLGAFAGFLANRDVSIASISPGTAALVTAILVAIGLVYCVLWSPGIEKRNGEDQKLARFYWEAIDEQVAVRSPRTLGAKPPDNILRRWSRGSQIIITALFVIVAIIFVWQTLSVPKGTVASKRLACCCCADCCHDAIP